MRAWIRVVGIGLCLAALPACAAPPPPRELIPVPTRQPDGFQLAPQACPAALLEGVLVVDDEFGFVVEHVDGFSSPVTWPNGYVARAAERRELLDSAGRVVAREGDHVSLGGGETGEGPGFVVCGDGFEVRPAARIADLGLPFDVDCGPMPAAECRERALEVVEMSDRGRFGVDPVSLVFNESGGFYLEFSDGTAVGADQ